MNEDEELFATSLIFKPASRGSHVSSDARRFHEVPKGTYTSLVRYIILSCKRSSNSSASSSRQSVFSFASHFRVCTISSSSELYRKMFLLRTNCTEGNSFGHPIML